MKKLELIMIFLVATSCFAQNSVHENSDSLSVNRMPPVEFKSNELFQMQLNAPSALDMNRFYQRQLADVFKQKPIIKIPEIKNTLPLALNLNENLYNQYALSNTSWINTSRTSIDLYGMGGLYTVGATYNHKIGDFGILTGGIYAAKFNIYNNFYNNAGVNGNFKLILNDRMCLNFFGQYTPMTNTTQMQLMSPMYPQSNYGSSFEFKVTDKWGVITGAEREFDVFSRKWVTRPFIMPVFYK